MRFIELLRVNMNFDELCKKLTGEDLSKSPGIPISSEIENEMSVFLSKSPLSTESDIKDYAKYLALEHGNDAVDKDLIEKIFIRVILLKLKK